MQKAGSRLHLQSLAWGAAKPSAAQQQESARANLRQEAEICITGYVRELGDQPSAASELAVRRLQMLDDVAQALCHAVQMLGNGKRRASRFLPTVGDERTSLGLEHWGATGKPLGSISSVAMQAMQGYSGRPGRQGGRQAGTAAGTANWTSQRVLPHHHPLGQAGGRYRENYLQSLAGPDLENESKILVSNIRIRSTATTILVLDKRTCVPGASHDAAACCLTLFCFLFFFSLGRTSGYLSTQVKFCWGPCSMLCSMISCGSK